MNYVMPSKLYLLLICLIGLAVATIVTLQDYITKQNLIGSMLVLGIAWGAVLVYYMFPKHHALCKEAQENDLVKRMMMTP